MKDKELKNGLCTSIKDFFAEIKNQHISINQQRGNDTCYFKIPGLLFSLFNEIFSSMFLTFVISRIKVFIFNDSDLLEL